jgi:micrococcal nuclease
MRRFSLRFFPILFIALITGCGGPARSATESARSAIAPASSAVASRETATPGSACVSPAARRESAVVTYVTDGDSIEVDVNGVPFRVRYIGMDAPEMEGEALGGESAAANRTLVAGKTIVMVRDLSEADRYGRLLRYVFVDGLFVNRELVRTGMARAGYYPPDLACVKEFQAAEQEARTARIGIWGLLGSPTFLTRVGGGCPDGCLTPPAGCTIKGNINLEGEKIYHVPGGQYYQQTVIEPELGERWFCSEEEAVAAGWRKSKV